MRLVLKRNSVFYEKNDTATVVREYDEDHYLVRLDYPAIYIKEPEVVVPKKHTEVLKCIK